MKIKNEVLNNVKINFGLTRNAVSRGELELQVQSFQINVTRRCPVGVPRIVSAEIYFNTFFLSRLIAG